jgi:hypothetical protein
MLYELVSDTDKLSEDELYHIERVYKKESEDLLSESYVFDTAKHEDLMWRVEQELKNPLIEKIKIYKFDSAYEDFYNAKEKDCAVLLAIARS